MLTEVLKLNVVDLDTDEITQNLNNLKYKKKQSKRRKKHGLWIY